MNGDNFAKSSCTALSNFPLYLWDITSDGTYPEIEHTYAELTQSRLK